MAEIFNKNIAPDSFLNFAFTLEKLADTRRIDEKILILKNYLLSCQNDPHLYLILRFLSGEYVQFLEVRKISVGSQLLGRSASDYLKIDYDLVFRPCRKAMGRTPETIARLIENIETVWDKTAYKNYSISQTWNLLIEFSNCEKRQEKQILLDNVWMSMSPVEIRFFLQLLSGKLSTGLPNELLLNAIVDTFNFELEYLRKTYQQTGSLSETFILAKDGIQPETLIDTASNSTTIYSVLLYIQTESRGNVGVYSELTIGIRVDQDDRFDQDYIPIGKITGGISDNNLEKLNQLLPELTLEKFGTTLMLKPEIVVEIEFEKLVKNNRTKAGYTIKTPRIVNFHWDKPPLSTHNLEYIIDFFQKNGR
ncbi:MAG TPA: hypothetical protein DCE78_10820 [Bacteroidetes bacterium]|nr:hypothetical protein [Bacteroidota bacterium]